MKLFTSLLITIFLFGNSNAQVAPNIDEGWLLNSGLSDEFNTLDLNKWEVLDLWNGVGFNWGGHSRFKTNNVSVSNGELVLRTDGPETGASSPYTFQTCCNTGGIWTSGNNYQYGYYEILAKLPGNMHNGVSNGEKFWPCFWTYYTDYVLVHDEIDILEPSGLWYFDGKTNSVGWHDEDGNGNGGSYKVSHALYTSPTPLFLGYHKFAVEWLPDRLIFYFDDVPFYAQYNHPSMIMQAQKVVIDLQLDENIYDFNSSIVFPQYMYVNYFRFYEMNYDGCNMDLTILNNGELNSYIESVKKNVYIGDGTTQIILNVGDVITFRHDRDAIILGDFETPLGAELNIIPTRCIN